MIYLSSLCLLPIIFVVQLNSATCVKQTFLVLPDSYGYGKWNKLCSKHCRTCPRISKLFSSYPVH